ncbi:MAG: TIGR02678 family protein [Clostridia bacterium]|nr:TIGR02678 family protein [Clostridia bacterium]
MAPDDSFDDIAKEAMTDLMEQWWILRDREPEKYRMVRDRETALAAYALDKLGFRLVVHRYFARLEKIPAEPEASMGILDFKHPRDYAIFACLLAYLDRRAVEEQFLLSEVCEDLRATCPTEIGLDWVNYEHRKSLVRVLTFAQETGIIQPVEGDVERFSFSADTEVLYDVTVVSRYFMRPYPKDLSEFRTMRELLAAAWGETEGDRESTASRRRRIYRELFLCPVMYGHGSQDPDILYLRNYRNRIREDIEAHTDFRLELYRTCAMLVLSERKIRYTAYPDTKGISDISLQLATVVREALSAGELQRQPEETIRLTPVDFERLVMVCKSRYGPGWGVQHREAKLSEVARELEAFLIEWRFARKDPESGMILLMPALGRVTGEYPAEFEEKLTAADRAAKEW